MVLIIPREMLPQLSTPTVDNVRYYRLSLDRKLTLTPRTRLKRSETFRRYQLVETTRQVLEAGSTSSIKRPALLRSIRSHSMTVG